MASGKLVVQKRRKKTIMTADQLLIEWFSFVQFSSSVQFVNIFMNICLFLLEASPTWFAFFWSSEVQILHSVIILAQSDNVESTRDLYM